MVIQLAMGSMCFCFFRKKVAPRDGNPPVRWSKAPVG